MWGAIKKAINSNLNKSLDVLIQEKATETNNKVDTKASQTSVDTINSKTGATTDTGGTASVGSIFAKLNKLLTDWTTTRAGYLNATISSRASQSSVNVLDSKIQTVVNGRIVKSVQRGTTIDSRFSAGEIGEAKITINTINPDKSMVLIDGSIRSTNGYITTVMLRDLKTTELILGTRFKEHGNQLPVSWQVIEFY